MMIYACHTQKTKYHTLLALLFSMCFVKSSHCALSAGHVAAALYSFGATDELASKPAPFIGAHFDWTGFYCGEQTADYFDGISVSWLTGLRAGRYYNGQYLVHSPAKRILMAVLLGLFLEGPSYEPLAPRLGVLMLIGTAACAARALYDAMRQKPAVREFINKYYPFPELALCATLGIGLLAIEKL